MSPRVGVICGPSHPVRADIIRELIGDLATVELVDVPGPFRSPDDEARFVAALEPMTCVVVRGGSFPRSILERLPNLRHIAAHAAGFDRIDLEAATERGIQVTNAPGGNATSVAELTIGLAIALARDFIPIATAVKAGQWDEVRLDFGSELRGRRLGVLGVGAVGSKVAALGLAFGMDVVAYDPAYTAGQLRERGLTWLPSERVIQTADFLTLHLPLDQTTRRLIDASALASMKRGAYFLNLSRGPVVDEQALAEALRSGHLTAAALDVREVEPPGKPDPLRELPNIVMTPHMGGSTSEAMIRIAEACARDVVAILTGAPVTFPVNRLERSRVQESVS
jgi:phosphoglycerate dehydrogenase-like enzyme